MSKKAIFFILTVMFLFIPIISIIPIASQAQVYDLSDLFTQGYLYTNSNLSSIPAWTSPLTSTLANQYTPAFNQMNQDLLNLGQTNFNQTSLDLSGLYRLGSSLGSYWPVYSSSWLNHPPIMGYGPEVPIVTKAGQSASTYLWVIDPDWDMPLFSSSIGATGRDTQGRPIWEFNTNFPGVYTTNILAYDQRGGFSSFLAPVIVKPWWSF